MTTSSNYSSDRCFQIVNAMVEPFKFGNKLNMSYSDIDQLYHSCRMEWETESSDRFSKPMVWIGIYIATASFFCILAMAADLLHGFRSKKLWFPCKYFSLNAASITVIAVAMKLTVDLSSVMPNYMDQETKPGSLAFMCTMMANLMPSLASLDNTTLLTNVIGLSILVITMVVNICIQINTDVITNSPLGGAPTNYINFNIIASLYAAMVLLLLIIMVSSSLTIPTFKEILESKYQATYKISLNDQRLQHIQMSRVEKLRQHVRRYWVMAETGCPQFVMASNPLSIAAGLICVISLLVNIFLVVIYTVGGNWMYPRLRYTSPYQWSTTAIFVTQSAGVVVGTIAPVSRCFSVLSFKSVTRGKTNHFMFLKVEKYYTQKLHEWKQSPIPFLSINRRSRSIICNSKDIILNVCIGFQKVVVVLCKLIWLVATRFVVKCLYCGKSLKPRWFTPPISSSNDDIDEDLSHYVLQIDEEMELAGKTLTQISNSVNSFILKTSEEQDSNLLKLLENTTGFEGVEIFDTDQVQTLLPNELVNTWSLPIVTLTCIAVVLPSIPKDTIENLFKSVGEGLSFTHIVEENLNCSREYVYIRKASMALWHEVRNKCKWLDIPLEKEDFKGKTTIEIIKWFSDKAKEIVTEINESTNGELVENPSKTLIAANSMYRITQTILLRHQSKTEPFTHKELFAHLNGMIADIFYACFTNMPRVITMKCHESVIEKRGASVKVAAKLLGKTTKIIERLETREVPIMDDEKMAYIDEWRLYLKQSIP
ncbi:hypothetical protein Hanom_Chr17g01539191 [Helianthus anomalus]